MSSFVLENNSVMVNGFQGLDTDLCLNLKPEGTVTVSDWEHRDVEGFYISCYIDNYTRTIADISFEKALRLLGIDSRTNFVKCGDVYVVESVDADDPVLPFEEDEPLGSFEAQADVMFKNLTGGIYMISDAKTTSHKSISSFKQDEIVSGHYLITGIQTGTTKNGSPYLRATVQDRTAKIPVVFWDYHGSVSELHNGEVVLLEGVVGAYDDKPQICLDTLELAADSMGEKYSFKELVPVAPINVRQATVELLKLAFSIADTDYRELCLTMLCRHRHAFLHIPAAKSVHHAFLHGLLMHTLNVAKTVNYYANAYGDFLLRDLLITGAILHDIGKIQEFEVSSCGVVKDYTVKGSISNHLIMGATEIKEVAKSLDIGDNTVDLLCHLILSHHGKFEYGAAVLPCLAEAELLHLADDADAKLESCRAVLERSNADTFTEKILALGNRRVYKHAV